MNPSLSLTNLLERFTFSDEFSSEPCAAEFEASKLRLCGLSALSDLPLSTAETFLSFERDTCVAITVEVCLFKFTAASD